MPVVAPEGEPSALPTPESYEWFTQLGETVAPNWRNEVSLESMEAFLEYDPAGSIHLISPTPLLMVVAEKVKVSTGRSSTSRLQVLPPT